MSEKEFAKKVILIYFNHLAENDKLGIDGFREVFAIQDDDKVLLEHIKAWKTIFDKAIVELEGENVLTSKEKI